MEFRGSFLSRLFEDVRSGKPGGRRSDGQIPAVRLPEQEDGNALALKKGHSFQKLWELYCRQVGWQPRPRLVLEDSEGTLLTQSGMQTELLRLRITVNTTANTRLEKIRAGTTVREDGNGAKKAVMPDLDAQVMLFFTKDCTGAWLLVYPPVGRGRDIDLTMLREALEAHGVSYGVNEKALAALPRAIGRYFRLVQVAQGRKPVKGEDGRVDELYPRRQEPALRVDGTVNNLRVDFLHDIEENGVICWIAAPTDGQPGRTVQDREIAPQRGREAEIPCGRNTAVSADGRALIATTAGNVEFTGGAFSVRPVLDVPGNVDYSVGNINFQGDVHIHGDVYGGFTVRATGNIVIEGIVGDCTVEAGRDIFLPKGVRGEDKAVLHAHHSLLAKRLERCRAYAGVNLELECAVECELRCGGGITVRAENGRSFCLVGARENERMDAAPRARPEKAAPGTQRSARLARLRVQMLLRRSRLEAARRAQQKPDGENAARRK